jgi:hypothetical protein
VLVPELASAVVTAKQGTIRYSSDRDPGQTRAVLAQIAGMPEWMVDTQRAARQTEATENPEVTETALSTVGRHVPSIFEVEGVGFQARAEDHPRRTSSGTASRWTLALPGRRVSSDGGWDGLGRPARTLRGR